MLPFVIGIALELLRRLDFDLPQASFGSAFSSGD